ncbi:MAG: hypothetical protein GW936_10120 [Gallionella sp.]|nr:hypothetical protein [Gallionella sp.]
MTGLGIFILAVCAIGTASVLIWIARQLGKLNQRFLVKHPTDSAKPKKPKYIRIGYERKLVCYDDLPEANKYSGRTWLGGLPVYADIIIPSKYNYATVVYMDHWFKQYVYDVMCIWKSSCDGFAKEGVVKSWFYVLFFPVIFIVAGVSVFKILVIAAIIFAYLYLWPSTMPIERRQAENAKDFTPDTWREIYKEVAESREREDEIVRAIRRSGIH